MNTVIELADYMQRVAEVDFDFCQDTAQEISIELRRLAAIEQAALNVLSWIEANHRPPVRDAIPVGRMAGVRLEALAYLYESLGKPTIQSGLREYPPMVSPDAKDAARYRFIRDNLAGPSGASDSIGLLGFRSIPADFTFDSIFEHDVNAAIDKAMEANHGLPNVPTS